MARKKDFSKSAKVKHTPNMVVNVAGKSRRLYVPKEWVGKKIVSKLATTRKKRKTT